MEVLIVDDEPIAQRVLKSYVQKVPQLRLVGVAANALEAFGMVTRQHIDLMFLDINMPEISGIDFLKTLKQPPSVVFTTAYKEYAVESYELNAVDYLVKPIPFERFLKAVDKVTATQEPTASVASSIVKEPFIFVKSEGRLVSVHLSELHFVEGLKDYIRLWTESGKLMVLATMQHMEEQLADHTEFIRVSRSYIVNLHHIKAIDGNAIMIKEQSIAIGNTYRNEVFQFLEKFRLM